MGRGADHELHGSGITVERVERGLKYAAGSDLKRRRLAELLVPVFEALWRVEHAEAEECCDSLAIEAGDSLEPLIRAMKLE